MYEVAIHALQASGEVISMVGKIPPLAMGVEKGVAWAAVYLFGVVQGEIRRRKNRPTGYLEANR